MGEVARWVRAKPGAIVTEEVLPVFYRKTGFSEYLRCKYSDSPRPAGTPLINAGGKRSTISTSWHPQRIALGVF